MSLHPRADRTQTPPLSGHRAFFDRFALAKLAKKCYNFITKVD